MAANMHNQDDKRQSFDENESTPLIEPSWVKPVKIATGIMGVMIIAGLILLVYGLSVGIGEYGARNTQAEGSFIYPEGFTPVRASAGAEGTILLELEDGEGKRLLVHMDPAGKEVISTTILSQGNVLGFAE